MTANIPVETLKRTIAYFYLLSYCPAESIADFKQATAPLRRQLADQSGVAEAEYLKQAIPEVSRRIVAYHQATREPGKGYVEALIKAASNADQSPETALAFQWVMDRLARLAQRARPENRLHRNKGCRFCSFPCHYGYFTLVSEPRFDVLQRMLEAETRKPPAEQDLVIVIWGFTIQHLSQVTGTNQGYITPEHLRDMAYCLLMMATAKSRRALPEEQLLAFQAASRRIQRIPT